MKISKTFLAQPGSEADEENIPVVQLPPIVPSTSDDNCRPQLSQPLPQQSPSHKEDNQDTVPVTVMPPSTSDDNRCRQLVISQPLVQQSPSHKEDNQDTTQVTVIPPLNSKDNRPTSNKQGVVPLEGLLID